MSEGDRRSFRVALVEDRYLNSTLDEVDAIPVLLDCGWGLIQLPADGYSKETVDLILAQVAEQAEEFVRRGYDVVVVGDHPELDRVLAAAGVPHLERVEPASSEDLRAFLSSRPAPRAAGSPGSSPI